MYGTIIGDLAGSIYEFDQTKKITNIKTDELIKENSFYSDDTILTIAVIDAIINKRDYGKTLRKYIREYSNYKPDFSPYFKTSFSPNLIKWANSKDVGTSIGNGAMMRISPVGYLFNSEDDVIKNARLVTIPSHNSKESIECATKIALIIFYLRKGYSIDEIYKILSINPEYRPFEKFNTTCYETIYNCLYVVKNSNNFEDAIKKTLYMGGDTDTNSAIVGGIVEAIYGIDDSLIEKVNDRIPKQFTQILKKVYM